MKTLLTLSMTAAATLALAMPAQADQGSRTTRGAVAASTYAADKVDSSKKAESRQTAKRVVIVRDPNLRQVTVPTGRSLAVNPNAR